MDVRGCKLPHETSGFKFLREYSQKGCELECAIRKATSFCQCLPWQYPNNFSSFPICDMFGGHCFNHIVSSIRYYKTCKSECLEDCQHISLSLWHRTVPLDTQDLCKDEISSYYKIENNPCSRSHTSLVYPLCQYSTNKDLCPHNYVEVAGSAYGAGSIAGWIEVESKEACGALCDQNPACSSIEYSTPTTTCHLNWEQRPTRQKYLGDFVFCSKQDTPVGFGCSTPTQRCPRAMKPSSY